MRLQRPHREHTSITHTVAFAPLPRMPEPVETRNVAELDSGRHGSGSHVLVEKHGNRGTWHSHCERRLPQQQRSTTSCGCSRLDGNTAIAARSDVDRVPPRLHKSHPGLIVLACSAATLPPQNFTIPTRRLYRLTQLTTPSQTLTDPFRHNGLRRFCLPREAR